MNTIIEKIRAWVEREKEKQMDIWRDSTSEDTLGMALDKISVYNQFLSFLSTIAPEKPNKVKADFDIYRFQQKFCIHCEIPHCTGLKSCPYLNK